MEFPWCTPFRSCPRRDGGKTAETIELELGSWLWACCTISSAGINDIHVWEHMNYPFGWEGWCERVADPVHGSSCKGELCMVTDASNWWGESSVIWLFASFPVCIPKGPGSPPLQQYRIVSKSLETNRFSEPRTSLGFTVYDICYCRTFWMISVLTCRTRTLPESSYGELTPILVLKISAAAGSYLTGKRLLYYSFI